MAVGMAVGMAVSVSLAVVVAFSVGLAVIVAFSVAIADCVGISDEMLGVCVAVHSNHLDSVFSPGSKGYRLLTYFTLSWKLSLSQKNWNGVLPGMPGDPAA